MQSAIPIILLAAGAARRMRGADKLMTPVEGLPLIRRQAEMARAVTSGPVLVTLPPRPHPRYGALRDLAVTALPVPDAAEGMAASLRAGFSALPAGCPAAMLLLADLPELTPDDLRTVLQSVDLKSGYQIWRAATADGKPGHPIVFSAALFSAISQLKGDDGARQIVAAAGDRVALIPLPGRRALLDLDTPEDWAAWRAQRP